MTDFRSRYGPWGLVVGASEGLGAAFAHELARRGVNVVLVARRADKMEQVREQLASVADVEVRCVQLDLAQVDAVSSLCSRVADLDIGLVVANAAVTGGSSFLDWPLEDQERVVDVNVRVPMALAYHFGRPMRERGSGGIVLMSSLTAFQGSPFVATYGASKAFSLSLGEALWFELAPQGIDVLTVCAGATRTPHYLSQATQRAPGELEPGQVASEAVKRLGRGPLMIPGRFNRLASWFMRRLLSRRQTISLMGNQTRRFSADS